MITNQLELQLDLQQPIYNFYKINLQYGISEIYMYMYLPY